MVICSSISEIGTRPSHNPRLSSGSFIKMAPKPHSLTNYNSNKQGSFLTTAPSTISSKGFRLQEQQDDTGSVYSLYKQKIDSMFNEPDSISNIYQSKINNTVQQRIEKMFSDITMTENPIYHHQDTATHSFTVDYLGSIPLGDKVTSLAGLQEPLKELYFAYRKNIKHKKVLTGRLEISQGGLKVLYQGEKGDLEQLNTFPTIAVWSAVKFVINRNRNIEYAFLPLITDPDNINKNVLFRTLDHQDQKYILNESHSPLFTVVMRKFGVAKQLECHGFVCQTSEDAIVIAATLYKSLMSFMTRKNKEAKLPRNRNGISCVSIASTNNDGRSYAEIKPNIPVRPPRKKRSTTSSIVSTDSQRVRNSVSNKTKRAGPKIPEPSRQIKNEPKQYQADLDAIVPYPDSSTEYNTPNIQNPQKNNEDLIRDFQNSQKNMSSLYEWQKRHQDDEFHNNKSTTDTEPERGFQRAQSIRKSDKDKGIMSNMNPENVGDIFTKVTIPRSGSFLNAKGLTKYKSTMSRNNGQASGGSPLGFSELFNEFRVQEGLNSLDEILGAIIDSEGMSFNDLKPIYKEFLLKLALTLTKDELYQRSKSIMRRQKKKLLRRNSSNQNKRKKMIVGAKGLRKVFRRSFRVRFGQKFRSSKKNSPRRNSFDYVTAAKKVIANSGSSISTSSYDTRQFQPKEQQEKQATLNQTYRKPEISQIIRETILSTSEESDFLSLQRNRQKCNSQNCNTNTQNRNSSSGYVSCSECSYDSDSCTCVSADKCYCSLGQKNGTLDVRPHLKNTLTSCKSEEKCYCSIDKTNICKKKLESEAQPSKSVENNFYQSLSGPPKSRLSNPFSISNDNFSTKKVHRYYNDITNLQKKSMKPRGKHCYCTNDNQNPESLTWCGCDTDSCTDSNKCYCQTDLFKQEGTIFEQLKQRGFIPQSENLNTPPAEKKLSKKNSHSKSTKSSKSLEYLRNPEESPSYCNYDNNRTKSKADYNFTKDSKRSYSSDNLALDYELFTVTNSKRKNGLPKQKGRTASECGGLKSVFKASDSMRSYNNTRTYSTHSSGVDGNHEALSVKKSAEIAAMFADVKLSQTTDITHLMAPDYEHDRKQLPPMANLNSRINNHVEQQRKALLEQQKQNYREIFANNYCIKSCNSITSKNSIASRASNASKASRNSSTSRKSNNKNDLFSAKNGLYTIQSQSDDSRHSSAKDKQAAKSNQFECNSEYVPTQKIVSSNLENSLGYLP